MTDKVLCVYDDSVTPSEEIRSVIGDKSFGSIILKRKTIFENFSDNLRLWNKVSKLPLEIIYTRQHNQLASRLREKTNGECVIHFLSNFIASSIEKSVLSLCKVQFVEKPTCLFDSKTLAPICYFFPSIETYKNYLANKIFLSDKTFGQIYTAAFIDLSKYENFMKYITGGFDSRYFNSISSDDLNVVKKSSNKEKIQAEYNYYYLLPETQRQWFVVPFNFQNDGDSASYSMERLNFTDVAIRFVHGAIRDEEYEIILRKIFRYIKQRTKRKVNYEVLVRDHKRLYIEKVKSRLDKLKESAEWVSMERVLFNNFGLHPLDSIFNRYINVLSNITPNLYTSRAGFQYIGHGDLCFSNILYHHGAKIIKFIDPRGALKEENLWFDEYYDLCKLSHSACGGYDFFNCGLFTILLNSNMKLSLILDFDYQKYEKIFKGLCQEYGFNYTEIRLYEVSLFLSMLPLHMDYPQKVLAFILNADRILKGIENEIKTSH